MADPEHLKILSQGVVAWNRWRIDQPTRPDLSWISLHGENFENVDFSRVNLTRTDLSNAKLSRANLSGADLTLGDLSRSNLVSTNLASAVLIDVNFTEAQMGYTTLVYVDLSTATGLESVRHLVFSEIGIETLYRSRGIPKIFLRGCGVPIWSRSTKVESARS